MTYKRCVICSQPNQSSQSNDGNEWTLSHWFPWARRFIDLSDTSVEGLKAQSFFWVRPFIRPWNETLRNPTIGNLLELTELQDVDSVHIDSIEALQLFKRLY